MLTGQTVLIVGGSSGIGLAVAKRAHERGARVIVASRNASERSEALREAIGEQVETHSFDIATGDHAGFFNRIGGIDHLAVTVRPPITPAPFIETDIADAMRAFDVKFWGVYRLIRAAHDHMTSSGSITLTSGIAGEKIYRSASTMALINTATETLCRSLALELAPLRVNAVSPGYVGPKPQPIQDKARQFPAGRLATADEVAETYIFLMENTYITGTVTVVDGGARMISG